MDQQVGMLFSAIVELGKRITDLHYLVQGNQLALTGLLNALPASQKPAARHYLGTMRSNLEASGVEAVASIIQELGSFLEVLEDSRAPDPDGPQDARSPVRLLRPPRE